MKDSVSTHHIVEAGGQQGHGQQGQVNVSPSQKWFIGK